MKKFLGIIGWFLGGLSSLWAQSYTPAQQTEIIQNARRLITDQYLTNLEILTHYEANQPFDALRPQLKGLITGALRDKEVLVFNEFREPKGTQTSVEEYVKDCRIFSGGKPIIHALDWSKVQYDFQRTTAEEPYLNVYLIKTLQGQNAQNKAFTYENLTEFRVQFSFHATLNSFLNFKIVGITKVGQRPTTAFTSQTLATSEKPKDLLSVLDTLTAQVQKDLPPNVKRLVLERFTYKNCGINDALSDQVFAMLSSCWQRHTQMPVRSVAESDEKAWIIRGSYEEDLNQLRLRMEVVDGASRKVLAQARSSELPLSWLVEQKLPLKPENYERVRNVQDTLRQITTTTKSALKIEIRTDRGRTGVEYWAGQQMFLEATANRPCHLRLLYRLADGTQTLLESDFIIKPGQENTPVRISPESAFICSPPYGTEYLLAYASEEAFCLLPTAPSQQGYVRNEGGYRIFVGSLAAFQTLMKCRKNNDGKIAEDHIQITTREAKGF